MSMQTKGATAAANHPEPTLKHVRERPLDSRCRSARESAHGSNPYRLSVGTSSPRHRIADAVWQKRRQQQREAEDREDCAGARYQSDLRNDVAGPSISGRRAGWKVSFDHDRRGRRSFDCLCGKQIQSRLRSPDQARKPPPSQERRRKSCATSSSRSLLTRSLQGIEERAQAPPLKAALFSCSATAPRTLAPRAAESSAGVGPRVMTGMPMMRLGNGTTDRRVDD